MAATTKKIVCEMILNKSQEGTQSCNSIGFVEATSAWYKGKGFDLYIINLYLANFCKFVNSKSSWKNEVHIK